MFMDTPKLQPISRSKPKPSEPTNVPSSSAGNNCNGNGTTNTTSFTSSSCSSMTSLKTGGGPCTTAIHVTSGDATNSDGKNDSNNFNRTGDIRPNNSLYRRNNCIPNPFLKKFNNHRYSRDFQTNHYRNSTTTIPYSGQRSRWEDSSPSTTSVLHWKYNSSSNNNGTSSNRYRKLNYYPNRLRENNIQYNCVNNFYDDNDSMIQNFNAIDQSIYEAALVISKQQSDTNQNRKPEKFETPKVTKTPPKKRNSKEIKLNSEKNSRTKLNDKHPKPHSSRSSTSTVDIIKAKILKIPPEKDTDKNPENNIKIFKNSKEITKNFAKELDSENKTISRTETEKKEIISKEKQPLEKEKKEIDPKEKPSNLKVKKATTPKRKVKSIQPERKLSPKKNSLTNNKATLEVTHKKAIVPSPKSKLNKSDPKVKRKISKPITTESKKTEELNSQSTSEPLSNCAINKKEPEKLQEKNSQNFCEKVLETSEDKETADNSRNKLKENTPKNSVNINQTDKNPTEDLTKAFEKERNSGESCNPKKSSDLEKESNSKEFCNPKKSSDLEKKSCNPKESSDSEKELNSSESKNCLTNNKNLDKREPPKLSSLCKNFITNKETSFEPSELSSLCEDFPASKNLSKLTSICENFLPNERVLHIDSSENKTCDATNNTVISNSFSSPQHQPQKFIVPDFNYILQQLTEETLSVPEEEKEISQPELVPVEEKEILQPEIIQPLETPTCDETVLNLNSKSPIAPFEEAKENQEVQITLTKSPSPSGTEDFPVPKISLIPLSRLIATEFWETPNSRLNSTSSPATTSVTTNSSLTLPENGDITTNSTSLLDIIPRLTAPPTTPQRHHFRPNLVKRKRNISTCSNTSTTSNCTASADPIVDKLVTMNKINIKNIINTSDTKYDEALKQQARKRLREEIRRQLKSLNIESPTHKDTAQLPIEFVPDEIVDSMNIPELVLEEIRKVLGLVADSEEIKLDLSERETNVLRATNHTIIEEEVKQQKENSLEASIGAIEKPKELELAEESEVPLTLNDLEIRPQIQEATNTVLTTYSIRVIEEQSPEMDLNAMELQLPTSSSCTMGGCNDITPTHVTQVKTEILDTIKNGKSSKKHKKSHKSIKHAKKHSKNKSSRNNNSDKNIIILDSSSSASEEEEESSSAASTSSSTSSSSSSSSSSGSDSETDCSKRISSSAIKRKRLKLKVDAENVVDSFEKLILLSLSERLQERYRTKHSTSIHSKLHFISCICVSDYNSEKFSKMEIAKIQRNLKSNDCSMALEFLMREIVNVFNKQKQVAKQQGDTNNNNNNNKNGTIEGGGGDHPLTPSKMSAMTTTRTEGKEISSNLDATRIVIDNENTLQQCVSKVLTMYRQEMRAAEAEANASCSASKQQQTITNGKKTVTPTIHNGDTFTAHKTTNGIKYSKDVTNQQTQMPHNQQHQPQQSQSQHLQNLNRIIQLQKETESQFNHIRSLTTTAATTNGLTAECNVIPLDITSSSSSSITSAALPLRSSVTSASSFMPTIPYDYTPSSTFQSQPHTFPPLDLETLRKQSPIGEAVVSNLREIDLKLMELHKRKMFIEEMILKLQKDKMDTDLLTIKLQNEKFILLNTAMTVNVTNSTSSSSSHNGNNENIKFNTGKVEVSAAASAAEDAVIFIKNIKTETVEIPDDDDDDKNDHHNDINGNNEENNEGHNVQKIITNGNHKESFSCTSHVEQSKSPKRNDNSRLTKDHISSSTTSTSSSSSLSASLKPREKSKRKNSKDSNEPSHVTKRPREDNKTKHKKSSKPKERSSSSSAAAATAASAAATAAEVQSSNENNKEKIVHKNQKEEQQKNITPSERKGGTSRYSSSIEKEMHKTNEDPKATPSRPSRPPSEDQQQLDVNRKINSHINGEHNRAAASPAKSNISIPATAAAEEEEAQEDKEEIQENEYESGEILENSIENNVEKSALSPSENLFNIKNMPIGQFKDIESPISQVKLYENLILAAAENGKIYAYNAATLELIQTYNKHTEAITQMYICEDKGFMFTTSLDGYLKKSLLENLSSGTQSVYLKEPLQTLDIQWDIAYIGSRWGNIYTCNTMSNIRSATLLCSTDSSIITIKAAKEGPRKVLIVTCKGNLLHVRDATSGLLLRTFDVPEFINVYSILLNEGILYCGTQKKEIRKYDFVSGAPNGSITCGNGAVTMLMFRNKFMFVGCYDGYIYILDKETGRQVSRLTGSGKMILTMEIVGDKIITSAKDCSMKIINIPTFCLGSSLTYV